MPSFYALDVMRAATGRVPDYETLEERAREIGNASLAWPAPSRPEEAIDDQEHDLAVLRRLLDEDDPNTVKGHAHYLLKLNEPLRRSVIDRWARGDRRWSVNDGLTRVSLYTRPALAAQRLTKRSYSLTALQRFSACPYQFMLSGVYRLQPLQQPEPRRYGSAHARQHFSRHPGTLPPRDEVPRAPAGDSRYHRSSRPLLNEVVDVGRGNRPAGAGSGGRQCLG